MMIPQHLKYLSRRSASAAFAHRCSAAAAAALVTMAAAGSAQAAEKAGSPSESRLLIQIVILLIFGRLLGEILQRLRQPSVMGQLLAGVVLGPSVLGALWPESQAIVAPGDAAQKAMLAGLTQIGILLLLLLTGMETDLKLAKKVGRVSLYIAITGLSVPFLCGFALGEFLPADMLPRPELRLVTSLFLGTALAISSVKIVAMVIREMGFMRRDVGQAIVAAAIIEDSIGWIIIATTLGIAMHGAFDPGSFAWSTGGTILFLIVSFTVGQRIVSLLIRWSNDVFVSDLPVITMILVIMGVMALITDAIGVHTVLGAFVAGILIGQSPILTRHIDEQLRGLITAFFMPVFFAVAGLGTDLTVLANPALLLLTLAIIAIASFGKFSGAFIGGWLGGLNMREATAVGSAMNARGSTEVIVATIGLSMGALSQNLYTMIVAMAFLTTLAMPPMLRWSLVRIPLRDDEQRRLEREERDAKGFVSALQRILVVSDESPNAQFTGRIAGLIAGPRQILTTVLSVASGAHADGPLAAPSGTVAEKVERTASEVAETMSEEEGAAPRMMDVIAAAPQPGSDGSASEAVRDELRKGYDLLMIGLTPPADDSRVISDEVSEVALAYEGPSVIVHARGGHAAGEATRSFRILLPVRATLHSQRASEFAMELARATRSTVDAVFVAESRPQRWQRVLTGRTEEEAALKAVVAMSDTYGVSLRTHVHRRRAAQNVITRQIEIGRHDLVIMGVTRRPGEGLDFGQVAAEVLGNARCSVILVSS